MVDTVAVMVTATDIHGLRLPLQLVLSHTHSPVNNLSLWSNLLYIIMLLYLSIDMLFRSNSVGLQINITIISDR
jgi:hypothetical protein